MSEPIKHSDKPQYPKPKPYYFHKLARLQEIRERNSYALAQLRGAMDATRDEIEKLGHELRKEKL